MDQPSVEKQSPAAHDDLGQLSLKGDQTPASPTTACTSGEADSDEDTALTSAGCGSTTDSAPTMGEAPIACNGADEAAGAEHSVASPCGAAHCKEQRKCDAKQGGCCKMQRLLELQGALQKHITTADPKLRSVLLSIQTAALSPTVPTPGHDAVTSLQVATHCCPSSPRSRSTDIAADHKAASHARLEEVRLLRQRQMFAYLQLENLYCMTLMCRKSRMRLPVFQSVLQRMSGRTS